MPPKNFKNGSTIDSIQNEFMRRSDALYKKLLDQTVLREFFNPVLESLMKVRFSNNRFSSIPMEAFCLFGCLRHLRGVASLRELVQHFFHLAEEEQMPVPRSTYAEALNSSLRATVLHDTVNALVEIAGNRLPDRLANIKGLGSRAVFAIDGSYQKESAHFNRLTPKNGGEDNHKGHMMLTLFNVRLGLPIDVAIETRNMHETRVLMDQFDKKGGCLQKRNALFVVDRAFVNMPFWDNQKRRYKQTSVTRWKDNLNVVSSTKQDIQKIAINQGVLVDESIQLNASDQPWRRIIYCTPEGDKLIFLTNELELEPGIIAFLYLRRWDEEKCFDTWKNDFSSKKAWSMSQQGILQQALLAVMTSILVKIFGHHHQSQFKIAETLCLKKQDARAQKQQDKGQKIPWYRESYRYASKISRQLIRFLKECFLKKSSQKLYERELLPLFIKWI